MRVNIAAILRTTAIIFLSMFCAMLVSLTVPAIVLFVFFSYRSWNFHHNTPIATSSSGQLLTDTTFAMRIAHMFPIGSSAVDLKAQLTRQGFVSTQDRGSFAQALQTEQASFPCRFEWRISWTADSSGAIRAIKGDRRQACL